MSPEFKVRKENLGPARDVRHEPVKLEPPKDEKLEPLKDAKPKPVQQKKPTIKTFQVTVGGMKEVRNFCKRLNKKCGRPYRIVLDCPDNVDWDQRSDPELKELTEGMECKDERVRLISAKLYGMLLQLKPIVSRVEVVEFRQLPITRDVVVTAVVYSYGKWLAENETFRSITVHITYLQLKQAGLPLVRMFCSDCRKLGVKVRFSLLFGAAYGTPPQNYLPNLDPPELPEDERFGGEWDNDRDWKDVEVEIQSNVINPKVTRTTVKDLASAAREYPERIRQIFTAHEIECDERDVTLVAEYDDDIFRNMRILELRTRPDPDYVELIQSEIDWDMRRVLVDQLVQVHQRLNLPSETLFLAVNYLDRFLSCKAISLGNLQLCGTVALWLAAKREENRDMLFEVDRMLRRYADNVYSRSELMDAEFFMLTKLDLNLEWYGPVTFLRRISRADNYAANIRKLAKYFLEVTIMDRRFVACLPSFTAAGAYCLALLMLDKTEWKSEHIHLSQYTYGQLQPLLKDILSCCDNPKAHHPAVSERHREALILTKEKLDDGFEPPAEGCMRAASSSSKPGVARSTTKTAKPAVKQKRKG